MRQILHTPTRPNGHAVGLTHGAGGNADMPLLLAVANVLCDGGFLVLRYDLPFRSKRKTGPPSGNGAEDRQGIAEIARHLRSQVPGKVILGGQSYGGRQTTMAATGESPIADALLLFSYPLHPPGKPAQLRTDHFPLLKTDALFVSGTKDPFGSIPEITEALKLIPSRARLSVVEGAGHDLQRGRFDVRQLVLAPLQALLQADA